MRNPDSAVAFVPMLLNEAAATEMRERFENPAGNFGGLNVVGAGRHIADLLPAGLSGEALELTAEAIATQIGANVGGGIIGYYVEKSEVS